MVQGAVDVIIDADKRIVLQRRDASAPRDANLLTLFGGHREGNETSRHCITRELEEETSLNVKSLDIKHLFVKNLPIQGKSIKLSVFKVIIDNQNFKVYEGAGYEKHKLNEAIKRQDLVQTDRVILHQFALL